MLWRQVPVDPDQNFDMKTITRPFITSWQRLGGLGALGLASSALAAPTGFEIEKSIVDQSGWLTPDARNLVQMDLYVTFDNSADHLNAVNGKEAPLNLVISTSDPSGFFQSANGNVDTTENRNAAQEGVWPSMAADSWVTIGLTDQTNNAMLDVGIDFADFNSGGSLTITNGAWFVTPDDVQGDATGGRVLIGRFTHAAGDSLSATLNIQYVDAASGSTVGDDSIGGVFRAARSDFNGDGKSDLLWRGDYGVGNTYEGSVLSWIDWNGSDTGYSSSFVYDTVTSGAIPEEWIIAGTGDMNGDGLTDLVWRDGDGSVIVWLMETDGSSYTSHWFYSGSIADWRIAGLGDFDGDGQDDILWQGEYGVGNAYEGSLIAWEQWDGTDGGYQTGFIYDTVSTGAIPSDWFVAGLGDMNGSGRDELVWRNGDGSVIIWDVNAWSYTSSWFYQGTIEDWSIKALGDFDGDGQDDILWQGDYGVGNPYEGSLIAWEQWDGTDGGYQSQFIYDTSSQPAIPDTWTIVASGDMYGDGNADIIWRDPTGAVLVWDITDGWTYSSVFLYSGAIADWSIDSPKDIYSTGN